MKRQKRQKGRGIYRENILMKRFVNNRFLPPKHDFSVAWTFRVVGCPLMPCTKDLTDAIGASDCRCRRTALIVPELGSLVYVGAESARPMVNEYFEVRPLHRLSWVATWGPLEAGTYFLEIMM